MPRKEATRDDIVFFVDIALGKIDVANGLRSAGAKVELLTDHFDQGAHDNDWIPPIAKLGWVILSKDKWKPHSIEALALARVQARVFLLRSGKDGGEKMAQAFVAALPRMRTYAFKNQDGFIAKVSLEGKVDPWLSAEDMAAIVERSNG